VLPGSISGCLLALVQMMWQATLLQSDWFPAEPFGGELVERQREDLYLWIVHRHDYDEEHGQRHTLSKELGSMRDLCDVKMEQAMQKTGSNSRKLDRLARRLEEIAECNNVLADRHKKQFDHLAEVFLQKGDASLVASSLPRQCTQSEQAAQRGPVRMSSSPALQVTSGDNKATPYSNVAAGPTPRASSAASGQAISKTAPVSILELPTSADQPTAAAEHVAAEHVAKHEATGWRLLDVLSTTQQTATEPRSWAAGLATTSDVPLPLDRLPLQSTSSAGPIPRRGATSCSPKPTRSWWTNASESSFCDGCGHGRQLSSPSRAPSGPPVGQQQQQQQQQNC